MDAEWLKVGAEFVGLVFIPVYILVSSRQAAKRDKIAKEQREHAQRIDTCIDDLRTNILHNSVSREDMERMREQFRVEIVSLRDDTAKQNHGLHDRIMRLENIALGQRGD